jgi:hypothetical protein
MSFLSRIIKKQKPKAMKCFFTYELRLCFLLSLFLIVGHAANAQYQSLFGTPQTSWNVTGADLGYTQSDSLAVEKDTLINGMSYKKVVYYRWTGNEYKSYEDINGEPYLGFIREDTQQGKAWFFNSYDTAEKLIMDLGLQIGDMFYMESSWNSPGGNYPVIAVWNQNGRKHVQVDFLLDSCGGNINQKLTFIEGVGTNAGITYQTFYPENCPFLLCSHKNNNQEFQNSTPPFSGQCRLENLNTKNFVVQPEISFSPNPVESGFVLEQTQFPIHWVKIHDITGNQVRLFKPLAFYDISSLQPGLYFIKIQTGEGMAIKKIMKK